MSVKKLSIKKIKALKGGGSVYRNCSASNKNGSTGGIAGIYVKCV